MVSTYLKTLTIIASCYIAGCSSELIANPTTDTEKKPLMLETIYDAEVRANSIWYTVKSTGCTTKESFKLNISIDDDIANVSLIRTKRDLCRAMPKLISVEFPLDQAKYKNTKLQLNNPFGVNNFPRGKKNK